LIHLACHVQKTCQKRNVLIPNGIAGIIAIVHGFTTSVVGVISILNQMKNWGRKGFDLMTGDLTCVPWLIDGHVKIDHTITAKNPVVTAKAFVARGTFRNASLALAA